MMEEYDYAQQPVEIRCYRGSAEEDVLVAQWWGELAAAGDLEMLLFPQTHALGAFMGMWRDGRRMLFYALDREQRIWLACWIEPILERVAFLSLWIRRDLRRTRKAAAHTRWLYEEAFRHIDVIYGLTRQERLLAMHERSGYRVVSRLQNAWGGVADAWLLELQRDNFTMRRPHRGREEDPQCNSND